ncbi:biotin-dependent carboxyltransferase family protein [Actinomadura madurae]|uniref:5-oxoprolinase subunit C family protein n=1 Tax=Actinomadura madurae TaxID=1993 RepID=UPI0020270C65|nr:biotin-dependent carboxyltransferase family protein [Actinomadura madurae]URN01117.1 biotin-dependent carboxyltransferase family protein [Actinomadura madurae]
MISVVTPGLHTTIQDLGRPGHFAMGLPPSGALDQFSHRCANLLVGNSAGAATLELTMTGPALHFKEASLIAVTGGDVDISIDDHPVETWTSHAVSPEQVVRIGILRTGARAYLAIRGGIDSPRFLESRSTYTSSRIGGLSGEPLKAGDILPSGRETSAPGRIGASIDRRLRPALSTQTGVRVVEGLCNHRFTRESLQEFFTKTFTVTSVSDRTGYRLDGPRLSFVERVQPFGAGDNPSNVVDLGYPVGSIQAPNGDQAICLMRDAVTGGGYATLGTVISSDIDRLAQLKAPDLIRFESVDLDAAVAARKEYRRRLRDAATNVNLLFMF